MPEQANECKSSGLVPLDVASLTTSDVIDSPGAADLRWYFKVGGMAIFDRSTMSRMLERAELMFTHARACRKCGGDPKRSIGGCGWMPAKSSKRRRPSAAERELMRWARDRRIFLPPRADTPCTKCKGFGWVEGGRRKRNGPLTARPMGSSVAQTVGINVGDVGMQRLAIVSKRLARIARMWSLAEEILCAWYGPEDGNRLVSLWPFAPAGKTLLRRNHLDLDPMRFFENERADAQSKHDVQRLALFEAADEQASELRAAACRLWNACDLGSVESGRPVEIDISEPDLGAYRPRPVQVEIFDAS